jgi:molybdopterin synthase sulfur carrier subunit
MIKLIYFARLREALNCGTEAVALPADVHDVEGLRRYLQSRGGAWQDELASGNPVRVAVNQDIAQATTPVADGDEIAFFPPVTGG